jgi:hypothetical protein
MTKLLKAIRPPSSMGVILVVLLMALGAHLSAPLASADSSSVNSRSLRNMTFRIFGTSTSSTGGIASAGAATTTSNAGVSQLNIQIVAGQAAQQDNVVQTATNEASIDQTTLAAAGSATAAEGGIASAGSAWADSWASVQQLNIQIVAGQVPDGGITQTATNVAAIDQTTAAAAGNASATGEGSVAEAGDATASSWAFLRQVNLQVYIGTGRSNRAGAIEQTATNIGGIGQTTLAGTGNASATSGGGASTGNAGATSYDFLDQFNHQIIIE